MVFLATTVLVLQSICVYGIPFPAYNKDAGLNIYQLAETHGYPLETYEVATADGYLLTTHRIPYSKTNSTNTTKPIVFMMHGIVSSSVDWINIGPGKSLAYLLADQGYDVWLGNARGNTFSRKHKTLNPDKNKQYFWDFSWHEIGYFDVPAMIDYALEKTNQTQLQYVGFSQGTTTYLVMASTRPEYNKKIKFCTLLGPTGEMRHVKNLFIRIVAPFGRIIYKILQFLGQYEILPKSKFIEKLGFTLCSNGKLTQELCKQFIFAVVGTNREELDGGFIPVITTNYPAGSSLKQFKHFFQSVRGSFRQFDYNSKAVNIKHYGLPEAPKYDLGKITVPVAVYYGLNDLIASDADAILTASQMPKVVHLKAVDNPKWTHFDFLWAKNVDKILYKEVIMFINKYN